MQITFNPSLLLKEISELQKVQIPNASVKAVNQAVFDATKELSAEASARFSNPVPFTTRAFLYKKATLDTLEARVFIRDEAPMGNAPAKYLLPQIQGGKHYMTRFQGALLNTVVELSGGRAVQVGQRGGMAFPNLRSHKTRTNKYGNMTPGQYTQILSALRGKVSSADLYPGTSGANRLVNTQYIYLDEEELSEPFFRKRFTNSPRPGIYFVDRQPDNVRYYRVMTDSRIPSYAGKFQFLPIASSVVEESFARNFRLSILR